MEYLQTEPMKLFILFITSLVIFNSCCTKKKCAVPENGIMFSGFNAEELDTVYLVYHNNQADTILTSGRLSADSSHTFLSHPPDKRNDVLVIIPASDRQYLLTDFTYSKKEVDCNKCFLRRDFEEEFSGCKVNGVQQGSEVILVK